jgi:PEP-CTERM motif
VTKKGMLGRLSMCTALMCASAGANAVPVVYEFTGTGILNTYTGDGSAYITEQRSFFGTVTMDILMPEAPFSSPPPSIRGSGVGWVDAYFDIQWGDGAFRPADDGAARITFVEVWNTPSYDEITVEEYLTGSDGRRVGASLTRITEDLNWLTDLSFVHLGLAPEPLAYNRIRFENVPQNVASWSGFWGTINLTSLTVRPASVPEPATLGLLGLGLVGSMFARRTKKSFAVGSVELP